MDILVSSEATRVLKSLWAGVTRVWTFSSMLAQVILVMRTPFKSQGAIWAEEGAHSSVNTLMNLDLNKHTDVRSVFSPLF